MNQDYQSVGKLLLTILNVLQIYTLSSFLTSIPLGYPDPRALIPTLACSSLLKIPNQSSRLTLFLSLLECGITDHLSAQRTQKQHPSAYYVPTPLRHCEVKSSEGSPP